VRCPGNRVFRHRQSLDPGSARIPAELGFSALASSGACAGVLGRRDGMVTRQEVLDHARAMVAATDLPVSADPEKGFDVASEGTAETIRLAATVGVVGGSIEDFSANLAKAAVLSEPFAGAPGCRRRGGAQGGFPVHLDRASRELSARQSGPRRYDDCKPSKRWAPTC
jgi:Phosphoenolpyruvate phosphomutase